MIKLKSLLKLKEEKKHIDTFDKKFITVPNVSDSGDETGKKSWDVIYTDEPDANKRIRFSQTYRMLKGLADTFDEVAQLSTYAKDGEMQTFARSLRTLEQKFKEYIIKKGKAK